MQKVNIGCIWTYSKYCKFPTNHTYELQAGKHYPDLVRLQHAPDPPSLHAPHSVIRKCPAKEI